MFPAFKIAFGLMALVLMAACAAPGTVVINEFHLDTDVQIRVTAPRHQVPRGQILFSCTSINAIRDYIDYGDVARGCGHRAVTYITQTRYYPGLHGYGRTEIMEFSINSWPYYGIAAR